MNSSTATTQRLFITVGSTKFDALINEVLQEDTLKAFQDAGLTDIAVQCGNSALPASWSTGPSTQVAGTRIDIWKFKPSLDEEISKVDLVISHAGLSFHRPHRSRA